MKILTRLDISGGEEFEKCYLAYLRAKDALVDCLRKEGVSLVPQKDEVASGN